MTLSLRFSVLSASGLVAAGLALGAGCGTDDGGGDTSPFAKNARGEPCQGLACEVADCGSGTTSLSGTVFAPNGTLPLYNAIVYVPNKPLDAVPEGASCDRCGFVSGEPITTALTDTHGRFLLKGVPVGKDVPLVVQVGKWRRELVVPEVKRCADTPVPVTATRLPKNSSEGHIPKIAVTTGWCDQLACLLPKLGLDASEYSLDHSKGRLHLFRGSESKPQGGAAPLPAPAPGGTADAQPFWSDPNQLKSYDMLMLSCECGEHLETKPQQALDALYGYASIGGRVFASHFHYVWFQNGPPEMRGTAQWFGSPQNPQTDKIEKPFFVDTSFPKGAALSDWLTVVGASTTKGQMPINEVRENVGPVVSSSAQRWVYGKKTIIPFISSMETTKYLTVNAPVGKPVEQQCGKATFADMHLYAGDVQAAPGLPNDAFPASCSASLTAEEKALAFLFFDLSSCVQKEDDEPKAPAPK